MAKCPAPSPSADMRRKGHGASRSVLYVAASNPSATMKTRETSPLSDCGNDKGEAAPVALKKSMEPSRSYCGEVHPLPAAWQGFATTPPRVETHAVTAPSVSDTLREAVASNCSAVKANAPPQKIMDKANS